MRCTSLLALVVAAACARPPQAITPPQPGLFGPSSQPVLLPPRFGEPGLPRNDAEWRAVGREAAVLLSQYVAINTTNPPGNELKTAEWLKAVLALPEFRNRVSSMGASVIGGTPEQFAQFMRVEAEKWGNLIRENKIVAE